MNQHVTQNFKFGLVIHFLVLLTFLVSACGGGSGEADKTEQQLYDEGLAFYTANNYTSSISRLTLMIATYPSGSLVEDGSLYLAKARFWTGDYSTAINELTIFISQYPTSISIAEAHYWIGRAHEGLVSYSEAQTSYMTILSYYSTSVFADDATYGMGTSYYDQKDYYNAINSFSTVLTNYSLNSKSDNSQYYLAKSYHALDQYAVARDEFNTLITNYPTSIWLDNAQLQIGQSYFDEKLYIEAIAALELLATQYPDSVYLGDARYYIARANQESGEFDTARTQYLAMIAGYPTNTLIDNAQFRIGQSHYDEAETTQDPIAKAASYNTAINELQTVITSYPASSSVDIAQYYIVKSHIGLGDRASAETAYATLVANYPTSVFIDNGIFRLAKMSYEEALAAVTQISATYQTVITELQNVIDTTDGSDDGARYYIAKCYHRIAEISMLAGDFTTARLEYAGVNETNYPLSVYIDNAAYQTAKSYHDEGNYTTAITELNGFISSNGSSNWLDDAWYYLGHSYYKLATPNYAEARTSYEMVQSINPESVKLDNAQYYIGLTWHGVNNCTEEGAAMQALLDNYPGSIHALDAQLHIDGIGTDHTCA